MNRTIISALLFSFVNCFAYAQKTARPEAKNIKIVWELLENNYDYTGESRSRLTLSNSGNVPLPANWVIYFNGPNPRSLDPKSSDLKLEMVNGDFFKLYPGKTFKPIAPQRSASLEILTRVLKNKTDYPKGFYIAFADAPEKGIPIAQETKSAVDRSATEKVIAAKVYAANAQLTEVAADQLPPVFPTPQSYQITAGSFTLNKQLSIVADPQFAPEAGYLADELKKVLGVAPVKGNHADKNVIVLKKIALPAQDAYQLKITADQVVISAAGNEGIFYGIQSLKMLLPASAWKTPQAAISLKGLEISDAPRFGHRAFMMDIARNFQPKEEILKVIDLLSLYKINILHMHLNDDEGWRIEIPGLPELTTVGAKRGHTLTEKDHLYPSYGSGPAISSAAGSGYLSRADYIEILKYATTRHIQVIPEFETPGHARAAIKAMDARYARLIKAGDPAAAGQYLLRDLNDKSDYRSVQGWDDNVINPALPSVYTFLTKVTDETIAMYKAAGAPLKTVHFGGDEVPTGVWEQSPLVAALVKENKVKSVDEMWYYYFEKVNAMLKSRQLYLSGWEEIGLHKEEVNGRKKMVLDPRFVKEGFHTDVWNNLAPNEDLAYQLANAGYKVVLTNVTNMYMDLAYNNSYDEPGQYWGGYVDLDKLFRFIPYDYYRNQPGNTGGKEKLTTAGRENIIGLQAPLWSEIITSKAQFEYLLLPKLLGLAERSWAADPEWASVQDTSKMNLLYQKAWSAFVNHIAKRELPRLDVYAGGFNYRIPTAGLIVENNMLKANVQFPGLTIRYTTDGTVPDQHSKIYTAPLPAIKNTAFRVFNAQGRGGHTVRHN